MTFSSALVPEAEMLGDPKAMFFSMIHVQWRCFRLDIFFKVTVKLFSHVISICVRPGKINFKVTPNLRGTFQKKFVSALFFKKPPQTTYIDKKVIKCRIC